MFKARGGKAEALSPVLVLLPLSSTREGGQLAAGCPVDRAGWAPAEHGGLGDFPPGANLPDSVEEFKSSKYVSFSPGLLPEKSSRVLQFASQQSAGVGQCPATPGPSRDKAASCLSFPVLQSQVSAPTSLSETRSDQTLCC